MRTWKETIRSIRESEELEGFSAYCRNYIIDNLPNYEGNEVDADELAYEITEEDTMNGTMTMSTQLAYNYLENWFDDCGNYIEYANTAYDKSAVSELALHYFRNPEKFMIAMVYEGVYSILSQLSSLEEKGEVVLDSKLINNILSEIEENEPEVQF